jgi:DNA-binding MarR family transcriptional regulator
MTSILDTLEKRGLIRREAHPGDRRKLLIAVTADGAAIVEEMLPSLHMRECSIMGEALTKPEQRQLRQMLAKVQASARAHADDAPDRRAKRVHKRRATAG